MTCPAESLRDARVIHALRPTPIARHKISASEYPRLWGLDRRVWENAAGLAAVCVVLLWLQGAWS